jgi:hypothetical protein
MLQHSAQHKSRRELQREATAPRHRRDIEEEYLRELLLDPARPRRVRPVVLVRA